MYYFTIEKYLYTVGLLNPHTFANSLPVAHEAHSLLLPHHAHTQRHPLALQHPDLAADILHDLIGLQRA